VQAFRRRKIHPPAATRHTITRQWLQRATGAVKLQYSENDIPAYFSFARQFTLCDNYFTEVRTQPSDAHRSRLPDNR
jgi:hypothetical protein